MSYDSELPDGWSEHFDPNYQSYYYHKADSDIVQWERPSKGRVEIAELEDNYSDMDDYSDMDEEDHQSIPNRKFDAETVLAIKKKSHDRKFSDLPKVALKMDNTLKSRPDEGGNTINYMNVANMYKMQLQYSYQNKGTPKCCLCQAYDCKSVFFPCEHRCVCDLCIQTGNFCEDGNKVDESYNICPICASVIKRILPFEGGPEVEKYWKWVLEVNPKLPDGFLENFRHSAAVIQEVFVNDRTKAKSGSSACILS